MDEGETYENPDDKFERMWANRWMLTDVERMSLEGEREARARNAAYKARKEAMQAEASSSVPAAAAPIPAPPASLKFPLTNTALSAADTFIGGGNCGFVLAIEEEVLVLARLSIRRRPWTGSASSSRTSLASSSFIGSTNGKARDGRPRSSCLSRQRMRRCVRR